MLESDWYSGLSVRMSGRIQDPGGLQGLEYPGGLEGLGGLGRPGDPEGLGGLGRPEDPEDLGGQQGLGGQQVQEDQQGLQDQAVLQDPSVPQGPLVLGDLRSPWGLSAHGIHRVRHDHHAHHDHPGHLFQALRTSNHLRIQISRSQKCRNQTYRDVSPCGSIRPYNERGKESVAFLILNAAKKIGRMI